MAKSKQGGQNKQGNIVFQDNKNAVTRFGFGGVGPITLAPKTGEMFYIEFHDSAGTNKKLPYTRFAKGVGGISVVTQSQPVDRYGKRVYVPTRVDFPEVQLSMYDVVDGQMFDFANQLYEQFFRNSSMQTDSANIENAIDSNPDTNMGRKFSEKGKLFHQSLEKIVVFHFFGNLDGSTGESQFSQNERTVPRSGSLQKIEIINPLVTNITFPPSDYSDGTLRTIEISVQPENVKFETVKDRVTFPDWLMNGLPVEIETAISDLESGQYSTFKTKFLTDKLNQLISKNAFDGDETFVPNTNEAYQSALNSRQKFNAQNTLINQQKHDELAKLYNATQQNNLSTLGRQDGIDPNQQFTPEQLAGFSSVLDAQNEIAEAEFEEAKSRQGFLEVLPTEPRFSDPFVPETKYPQVADFANLGNTYDGGTGRYGGSNFGGAIKNELVNAFFNGRSINWGNIRDSAAQGILGNTNIGSLQNLSKTSQSKFGIAGDIVRDGILRSSTASGGQIQTTTVPSNINANSSSTVLNNAQSSIANLKNLTNGIR
tara:strand:- start:800 stop:2422 length:1623 start_codon:yes stop_codon:yes gene_type:complete